ncbi:unnamed protein product [Paramecium sonneborni]|uniref:Uncharacterized protein n=1 Tax=Paramecium sonneborni TaxID=65129 RepID=A0A8S1QSD6_9CILI|nr:unnamed protein product [Paramecium sonneborni]
MSLQLEIQQNKKFIRLREINYVLFQNGCIISCPVHSSNFVDYVDMIQFSRYLAKGFYDLNMTTDDIINFYDETISTVNNFLTGQKFSIFQTKIFLGGLMVWNNAIYKKSWFISKPHHAVTLRFNFLLYNIRSKIQCLSNHFEVNQLMKFQKYFSLSTIENIIDTIVNPIDQYCAISDYFIVVDYCLPFCAICNDVQIVHQINFYILILPQKVIVAQHAIKMIVQHVKTQKNALLAIYPVNIISNKWCLLINKSPINADPIPNPTIKCNIYCETCTGTLINQLLNICFRFSSIIINNQCQFQSRFYDDGIYLYCLPFYGDLFIVGGENCYNDHNNPFDGSHNCKLGCDKFCNQCFQGFCIDCQRGLQIMNNQCFGNIVQIRFGQ